MDFTGQIKTIGPVNAGTTTQGKPYEDQTIVIEQVNEQYPNSIAISAYNKIAEVQKVKVGDLVKVQYNARAKESKGKWFTSLNLCKIEVI